MSAKPSLGGLLPLMLAVVPEGLGKVKRIVGFRGSIAWDQGICWRNSEPFELCPWLTTSHCSSWLHVSAETAGSDWAGEQDSHSFRSLCSTWAHPYPSCRLLPCPSPEILPFPEDRKAEVKLPPPPLQQETAGGEEPGLWRVNTSFLAH